jgi:hypothetical protein
MLITMAPQKALQKVSTWKPATTLGTRSSNSPFKTRMKTPSVRRISGAVRINRNGRTKALRMPSKSDAPMSAATVS